MRCGRTRGSSATKQGFGGSVARPHPLVRLVADGALARTESRGGHFRVDHPGEDSALAVHVVHRAGLEPTLESWL